MTPLSFSSPSSHVRFTSDDETTWTAFHEYRPPIHPASYHFGDSQAIHGLGISFPGTEIPFSQPTLFPPSETPPPVPHWPGQMGLPQPVNESMLAGGWGLGMDYVLYSNSPTSLYSSHEMNASSSYGGSQDSISDHQPSVLTPSPCPGNISPFNYAEIKEEIDELQGRALFPDSQNTAAVPYLNQTPPPAISAFPISPLDPGILLELCPIMEKVDQRSRETVAQSIPFEEGDTKPRRRKRLSTSSRHCHICDIRFTRSGNCLDHMRKAHNPNFKKSHCNVCGRGFQRPHDVRRHMDSVRWTTPVHGLVLMIDRFTKRKSTTVKTVVVYIVELIAFQGKGASSSEICVCTDASGSSRHKCVPKPRKTRTDKPR